MYFKDLDVELYNAEYNPINWGRQGESIGNLDLFAEN